MDNLREYVTEHFPITDHAFKRLVERDLNRSVIIEAVQKGKITYLLNDKVKFDFKELSIIVGKTNGAIISVIVVDGKVGKPSRQRKNKIARKKRQSWKRKL
jgi:hypothetical protein